MGLKIASRKSDLARLQAYQVGEALKKAHPDQEINYHFRESLGDLNQEDPLWKMPEKGVFTEDFREGLLKGQWDMVVHSWKDLPVEIPEGSEIVATLPRADMRDLFLLKKSSVARIASSQKLNVYTSSPRRIYNLKHFFTKYLPWPISQVEFQSVRGNIATRIQKMLADETVDGLIVAKAAIDRLLSVEGDEFTWAQSQLQKWLEQTQWMVLPLSLNPTAAAQGALAVEIAHGRDDLRELLQSIHCSDTWKTVNKEREILKSYGGGCHQKIGVSCLTREYGELTHLQGLTDQGEKLNLIELESVEGERFPQDQCFPNQPVQGAWFDREGTKYFRPSGFFGHFIARANALPEGEKFKDGDVLWTSGMKTWHKLAERGFWVHGSSESIGELENKRLDALAPDLPWMKWTHDQVGGTDQTEIIATYRLVSKEEGPDIEGKKNFYWMSGSSFKQALKKYPEILSESHYCGPGNTFNTIQKVLLENGRQGNLHVAIGFDHWKNSTWKKDR